MYLYWKNCAVVVLPTIRVVSIDNIWSTHGVYRISICFQKIEETIRHNAVIDYAFTPLSAKTIVNGFCTRVNLLTPAMFKSTVC